VLCTDDTFNHSSSSSSSSNLGNFVVRDWRLTFSRWRCRPREVLISYDTIEVGALEMDWGRKSASLHILR